MFYKLNVHFVRIAGLLLLLSGAAQANDGDDTIRRLAAQAREQARTGATEELAKTLDEIVNVLSSASPEGVAAAIDLTQHLARQGAAEQSQEAPPAVIANPGSLSPRPAPSPQPAQNAPVAQPGAPSPVTAPAPDARPAPPVPTALPPQPATSPGAVRPVLTVAPKADGGRLIVLLQNQGDIALGIGDISGARRFYQRCAEAGLEVCAEKLAGTYEAEQLRRIGAVGLRPDPVLAETWRARARQLRSPDAP